jgi:hypothetical protein
MLIVLSAVPIDQQIVAVHATPSSDFAGTGGRQDPIEEVARLDREPAFGRAALAGTTSAGMNVRRRMVTEVDHHDDTAECSQPRHGNSLRTRWAGKVARAEIEWAILDSNQGPLPYQRSALTN